MRPMTRYAFATTKALSSVDDPGSDGQACSGNLTAVSSHVLAFDRPLSTPARWGSAPRGLGALGGGGTRAARSSPPRAARRAVRQHSLSHGDGVTRPGLHGRSVAA